jgi:hypothetical protein
VLFHHRANIGCHFQGTFHYTPDPGLKPISAKIRIAFYRLMLVII